MTHASTHPAPTAAAVSPLRRALQVLAALSVVSLAVQFVTAGEVVGAHTGLPIHAAGAIVLHVLTGLTALVAIVSWRRDGTPVWVAVLATVVFVLTFVQAALGEYGQVALHVPGALVLTVGAVWVLVRSLARTR